jgi:hypothetical protein
LDVFLSRDSYINEGKKRVFRSVGTRVLTGEVVEEDMVEKAQALFEYRRLSSLIIGTCVQLYSIMQKTAGLVFHLRRLALNSARHLEN